MQPTDQNPQPISTPPAIPGGFISAVDAAARFNLSNDHIASLARKGKVEGSLIGRSWYVKEASLKAYIEAAERLRETRKTSLSAKLKSEYHGRTPAVPPRLVSAPRQSRLRQGNRRRSESPKRLHCRSSRQCKARSEMRESREHLAAYALARFLSARHARSRHTAR